MRGRITECHFEMAEKEFPGIVALYDALVEKPATFLELVWLYEGLLAAPDESEALELDFGQAA